MTKTIFKTLLSLLILFSISCGDRPTGSGGGTIGDNKETPQTETPASKEFLNNFNQLAPQYTGKIEEAYDNEWNRKEYSFDEKADMTVEGTKYTFWGMSSDGKFAYYYSGHAPYNFPLIFKDNSLAENYDEIEMSKIRSAIFDSSNPPNVNTPQNTTPEAEAWKSQVANKTFTSKSMTTYNYTFELGGNIIEKDSYSTTTYYFWGALDNNGSRVVYYKKYNARDYFGEDYKGEDKEIWEYCGFEFDKNNLTAFKKYELSEAYQNSFTSWSQSQNENNINWSSLPLPKRSDIDWSKPKTGTLTTK